MSKARFASVNTLLMFSLGKSNIFPLSIIPNYVHYVIEGLFQALTIRKSFRRII